MSFIIGDRVHEQSTTIGTTDYDLDGAEAGMQTFLAGVGTTNRTYYVASEGNDWEVGIGTVVSGVPNVLQRVAIIASTNGGAKVVWGAGTRDIVCTVPGQQFDHRSIAKSANFIISIEERGLMFECTNGILATLPPTDEAKSGFEVTIANQNSRASGTLVSIRPDGWLTGDKLLGLQSTTITLQPQQAMTLRVVDGEDDWIMVGEVLREWDSIGTGNQRQMLRLPGDGTIFPIEAHFDFDTANVNNASGFPNPLTDTGENDWEINIASSSSITFKNISGATMDYSYKKGAAAEITGTLADNATLTISAVVRWNRLSLCAGKSSGGSDGSLNFNGMMMLNYFSAHWSVAK